MNRPWVIWTILGVCALLIVGAMAWSTNKVLDLEEKQSKAESSAELEERVRLGLSRMDTVASGLLVLENQRPPHHFKAFFEPEDIFTNKFQVVGKGIVVQPSPLLPELPDFVRLHFEIDATTRMVRSPQVPVGNERDLAEGSGIAGQYLDAASGDLAALKKLLAEPGGKDATTAATNLDVICTTCATVNDAILNNDLTWNTPTQSQVEKKEAWVAQARGENRGNVTRLKQYQEDVAIIEKSKRAEVYNQTSQRAVPRKSLPNAPGNPAQSGRQAPAEQVQEGAVADDQALVELRTEVSPFQPIWLGEELMAVREVVVGGKVRYQGVWLKAGDLSDYLLSAAEDLLPHADLERIQEVSATARGVSA